MRNSPTLLFTAVFTALAALPVFAGAAGPIENPVPNAQGTPLAGTATAVSAVPQPLSAPAAADEELTAVTVRSTRMRINPSSSVSSQELNQAQIGQLPGGSTQSLPKVLFTTNPGFVEGSFGQVFARGNHANLQYDIDGIQLPDSVSGTFGDAFSVLDIDRMEVLTGGLPAEYGNRLAGVVNITTKSGGMEPGGILDMNYGSYNTFSPQATYGGSADNGHVRYFVSGDYSSTDRGLDTPEPVSESDQNQGGTAAVHDASTSNDEFGKLDWDLDDQNTLMFTIFNSQREFQIPDYPSGFEPTDAFFSPTQVDEFGNVGGATWTPSDTDDYQIEGSEYAEATWKHRFLDDAMLQLTPYVKLSSVIFNGDPADDLQAAEAGLSPANPVTADSFSEDRVDTTLGLQGDYTAHPDAANTVKAGFQLQAAEAHGPVAVEALTTGQTVTSTSAVDGSDHDYQQSVYAQDDVTLIPHRVVLNAGLRFDAIEYLFADGTDSLDGLLQPRLGLNYTPWAETKFHLYYGKLFQPAPAEDLRDSFAQLNGTTLQPYDIKSEKDDYYEVGAAQQVSDQLVSVNSYYKSAVNLLDDTQLLNTAITEPYNYAQGYVYGTELSINGRFLDHFSDFLTYSYEIAQGSGASGGLFALTPAEQAEITTDWLYLDHCQINTANAGLTWNLGGLTLGVTGLYGSGLRTGPDNTVSLPPHFTADGTASYAVTGSKWLEDVKVALDVTNVFDNVYPIFVDNGFNGSHYTAPTEFMVHVIKTL